MSTLQVMSQMRPPSATFTEKETPDQKGKVFIITGGYSGLGLELAKILYTKNAKVYLLGRSEDKANEAMKNIRETSSSESGELQFLFIHLNDLTTIQPAVEQFLQREKRLDVLWNNAGVMIPPKGSKTKQGYEMQLGIHCLGYYMLSQLLLPILKQTASSAPKDSVRVCFAGSLVAELNAPASVIDFDDINLEKSDSQQLKYGQSKAGVLLLGAEFARRYTEDTGVLFVTFNPGNLNTGLQRHVPSSQKWFYKLLLYPAVLGAYTELYAGLSPQINSTISGCYVIPWGRIGKIKSNLQDAINGEGSSKASRLYDWCEGEVSKYLK